MTRYIFAHIMINFKKAFNSKIILLLIAFTFSFEGAVYPAPDIIYHKANLRVPLGANPRLRRAMEIKKGQRPVRRQPAFLVPVTPTDSAEKKLVELRNWFPPFLRGRKLLEKETEQHTRDRLTDFFNSIGQYFQSTHSYYNKIRNLISPNINNVNKAAIDEFHFNLCLRSLQLAVHASSTPQGFIDNLGEIEKIIKQELGKPHIGVPVLPDPVETFSEWLYTTLTDVNMEFRSDRNRDMNPWALGGMPRREDVFQEMIRKDGIGLDLIEWIEAKVGRQEAFPAKPAERWRNRVREELNRKIIDYLEKNRLTIRTVSESSAPSTEMPLPLGRQVVPAAAAPVPSAISGMPLASNSTAGRENIVFSKQLIQDEQLTQGKIAWLKMAKIGWTVVRGGNGKLFIKFNKPGNEPWPIFDTSFEQIDEEFTSVLSGSLKERIKKLAESRKHTGERVYVMDWGAGNLHAVIELANGLRLEGYDNVTFIAFGNTYDKRFLPETIPDNVKFLVGEAEDLVEDIKAILPDGKKIDVIWGKDSLHFLIEKKDGEEEYKVGRFVKHIAGLNTILAEDGFIVYGVSGRRIIDTHNKDAIPSLRENFNVKVSQEEGEQQIYVLLQHRASATSAVKSALLSRSATDTNL